MTSYFTNKGHSDAEKWLFTTHKTKTSKVCLKKRIKWKKVPLLCLLSCWQPLFIKRFPGWNWESIRENEKQNDQMCSILVVFVLQNTTKPNKLLLYWKIIEHLSYPHHITVQLRRIERKIHLPCSFVRIQLLGFYGTCVYVWILCMYVFLSMWPDVCMQDTFTEQRLVYIFLLESLFEEVILQRSFTFWLSLPGIPPEVRFLPRR